MVMHADYSLATLLNLSRIIPALSQKAISQTAIFLLFLHLYKQCVLSVRHSFLSTMRIYITRTELFFRFQIRLWALDGTTRHYYSWPLTFSLAPSLSQPKVTLAMEPRLCWREDLSLLCGSIFLQKVHRWRWKEWARLPLPTFSFWHTAWYRFSTCCTLFVRISYPARAKMYVISSSIELAEKERSKLWWIFMPS